MHSHSHTRRHSDTQDTQAHAQRHTDTDADTDRPRCSDRPKGKQIHTDVELPDSPKAQQRRKANPGSATVGRIILHYHKNPIEYRNIWLEELRILRQDRQR